MRRRLERMPARLPRVGERPAGAERGEDLAMEVLSLATGDLGWRMARDLGEPIGLEGDSAAAGAALVRTKDDGLKKSLEGKESAVPLERLEKKTGSTFSKLSTSTMSAAFRLPVDGERAGLC